MRPVRVVGRWFEDARVDPDAASVFLVGITALAAFQEEGLFRRWGSFFQAASRASGLMPHDLFAFAVLFLFPAAFLLATGRKLGDHGLSLGRVRLALPLSLAMLPVITVFTLLVSRLPSLQGYYARNGALYREGLLSICLSRFLFLWSVEFIYRGFLIGGLRGRLSAYSIYIQLLPFVLLHLHKPSFELYGSILFGLVFGYLAYVVRSFVWCAFLHAYFSISLDLWIGWR